MFLIEYNGMKLAIEIADLIKNKISDAAMNFCIIGCFTGDTLVLSKEGYVKIEEIKTGDYVYSQDVRSGEKGFKEVLQLQKRNTCEFVKVKIEDEEIQVTPSHLFYTNGQWELAGNLKSGDILTGANGEEKKVICVEEYLPKEPEAIYNLSVDEYNTYFVSKEAILVHNWMCTKKKAQEITNLLKYGENLKDTTSKFKEFIEKYKISDKMDILDKLHRRMPKVREKYLREIKDLMDSGKSETEIVAALSRYDKMFNELPYLLKKERKTIRRLTTSDDIKEVSNTIDDIIKNRSNSDALKIDLKKARNLEKTE